MVLVLNSRGTLLIKGLKVKVKPSILKVEFEDVVHENCINVNSANLKGDLLYLDCDIDPRFKVELGETYKYKIIRDSL